MQIDIRLPVTPKLQNNYKILICKIVSPFHIFSKTGGSTSELSTVSPNDNTQSTIDNQLFYKISYFQSKMGYYELFISTFSVPPSIIDKETSSDMVVLESTNVSLTCKATGYPEPYVMWRREDGEDIRYNGENGEYILLSQDHSWEFKSSIYLRIRVCITNKTRV